MTIEGRIWDRLDEVIDPCSAANGTDLSIVDMGLVDRIDVDGRHVTVSMLLTSPMCLQIPYFMDEIERCVGDLDGIESVTLETDQGFEWHQDMMTDEAKERRRERRRALTREYEDQVITENAPAKE